MIQEEAKNIEGFIFLLVVSNLLVLAAASKAYIRNHYHLWALGNGTLFRSETWKAKAANAEAFAEKYHWYFKAAGFLIVNSALLWLWLV